MNVISPGLGRWEQQTISIRNDSIEYVERDTDERNSTNSLSRYADGYVLPGLVDLHTHLPPDNALKLTGYFCLLYLAHGVTSLRDTGDGDGTAVSAALRGTQQNLFPGPRIFACGPYIGGEPPRWANTLLLHGPEEADAAVARIKEQGFTCIKAYDGLTLEEIQALKVAAKKYDLPMIGHVPTELSYEEALIPNVQHFFGVPEPRSLRGEQIRNRLADWQDVDENRLNLIVETTLKHGIINTPTLIVTQQVLHYADYQAALADPTVQLLPRLYRGVVWHPTQGNPSYRNLSSDYLAHLQRAFDKKKELLRRLYEAGANVLIGTDVQQPFVVPGASVQQEMKIFVEAGIPLRDVWEIVTRKAGQELRVPLLGTIQPGAPTDLLIFREDPTQNFAALDTLEAVISQGHLYTRAALNHAQAVYQHHFQNILFDQLSIRATRRAMQKMFA
jgi:cytosine/adenosine deaminase-related metal-dependent hydrolase